MQSRAEGGSGDVHSCRLRPKGVGAQMWSDRISEKWIYPMQMDLGIGRWQARHRKNQTDSGTFSFDDLFSLMSTTGNFLHIRGEEKNL